MTKIDPTPIDDEKPIELTKAATAVVAAVEVAEWVPGAFKMDGKLLVVQACRIGDAVPVLKAAPGQPPHALHTAWKDGVPDPQSEIRFEAGDGWIDPGVGGK